MTKRFSRMIQAGLLPFLGLCWGCTELGDFDPQASGFGGGASSSSSAASGAGGGGCGVLETTCSGACANLDSDPMHCGVCGHSCQGGVCLASTCQPLVLALAPVIYDTALDATSIYWVTNEGSVNKVSIDGGDPVTLHAGANDFYLITVDPTTIYLVYRNTDEVVKLPIGGGSLTQLHPGPGGVRVLRVDETHIYWTNEDLGMVLKMPIGGGNPTALATMQMPLGWSTMAMVLHGSTVYFAERGGNIDFPDGLLKKVSISGGNPETLATEQAFPFHITALGPTLFWATSNAGGVVNTMPIGGGEPGIAFAGLGVGVGIVDMAIDASGIYWTLDEGNNHGRVLKVPLEGGEAVTLASLLHNPTNIELDATSVYWTDYDGVNAVSRVMKLAK